MRNYEIMILANASLQEEEYASLIDKIQQTIQSNQGRIIKVTRWGRRKLAYEIKGFQEANYMIFSFELDPESIANLEKSIQFDEKIIRYLLVLGQDKVSPKPAQKEIPAQEEKQENIGN